MALIPLNFGLGGSGGSDEVTATKNQVLAGYTAITSDSNDEPIEGTIPTKSSETYNTSSSDRTIESGQYLSGVQTIKGVTTENISAGNIKKNVVVKVGDDENAGRITNITGTYTTPSSGQNPVVAGAMLSGFSAFVNGGSEVMGNIASQAGKNVYAGTSEQTAVDAGKYCGGNIILKALTQSNLAAANILRGKTISVSNGSSNVFSVSGGSNVLKMISGSVSADAVGSAADLETVEKAYGDFDTFFQINIGRSITPVYAILFNPTAGDWRCAACICNYATRRVNAWYSYYVRDGYSTNEEKYVRGILPSSFFSSSYITLPRPQNLSSHGITMRYYVFGY